MPGLAEFEELRLLPPAPPTREADFELLDPACVGDPLDGPEQGKIIVDNAEALRARAVIAENANCELLVEYYTVASDRISIASLALLIETANRGVKIKILLDAVTHQIKDGLAAATLYHPRARQNIEIRLFNPVSLLSPGGWLARLHDKAVIADGYEVIFGGRNISNKYYGIAEGGFFDADLYVKGRLASHARRYFYELWNSDLVSPYRLTGYDYDTVEYCRQDDFRFDDGCQYVRNVKIPRIIQYTAALDDATKRLAQARASLDRIRQSRAQLVVEFDAKPDPSARELQAFDDADGLLEQQAESIRREFAFDVSNLRPVITQDDLDADRAFVANGPVAFFFDEPGEDKSAEGIAAQLRNFLETRIRDGAIVTVISPYIVLGRPARDLIDYLRLEKHVTFRFYTNSALSSDNVFSQAFYRHQYSKGFLVESGIEVHEFKGYTSPEEEERFRQSGIATTVHMKAALIENPGEIPIVLLGTFNVDLRSAHYNRELIAVFDADASAHQVRIFRQLTEVIETHGYRAGLDKYDADGNMNEWYSEYLKTPLWKRIMMKVLRAMNYFTGDWLRRQA